jgi:hypothetical protein
VEGYFWWKLPVGKQSKSLEEYSPLQAEGDHVRGPDEGCLWDIDQREELASEGIHILALSLYVEDTTMFLLCRRHIPMGFQIEPGLVGALEELVTDLDLPGMWIR